MASKATHASLWLPGFEIDAPAYPDLFSSNDEVAAPAADEEEPAAARLQRA